jgi:hypothetical protein
MPHTVATLQRQKNQRQRMRPGLFLVIAMLLLIVWAGSFLMLHMASVLIHLLLLLSVLFLGGHLVRDTSLN